MAWVGALDFGTTAIAAAYKSNGRVASVVLADGRSTASSSVFFDGDGLVVGSVADNQAPMRLDAYEPTPKRRITQPQVRLGDRDFAPAVLIGAVMAPVLGDALRQHNNATPSQVVLTHQWSWRATRRRVLGEALAHAATALGITLPEPVFVPEPVAAAQYYARQEALQDGECFAVYDLGGGSFDAAVLRKTGTGLEVLSSGGIDPLGGCDFDQLVFSYLGERYIAAADAGLWSGLSDPGQPDPALAQQRLQLYERVHELKHILTTAATREIGLPGVDDPVVVTRADYESLIGDQIDATLTELEETIEEAGLTPQHLTAIYRIGGASLTPLVGTALDRLQRPVKTNFQPQLVVSQGATATPTTIAKPIPRPNGPTFRSDHTPTDSSTTPSGASATASSDADAMTPNKVEKAPTPDVQAIAEHRFLPEGATQAAPAAGGGKPPAQQGPISGPTDPTLLATPAPSVGRPQSQRLSRRTMLVLGTVAVVVIATVAVVTIVGKHSTPSGGVASSTITSGSSSVTAPSATPTADPNARLMALVPADAHCATVPLGRIGVNSIADAECNPGSPLDILKYSLFSDQAGLDGMFGTALSPPPCPGMAGQEWHRNATPQRTEGEISCWVAGGLSTVYWTINSELLYGFARAPGQNIDRVVRWWSAHYQ